jgi:hypothetical protein
MVLPTLVAVWLFGGSLLVSWWACTIYVIVVGIGFLIRFQRGLWKSMRVIEPLPTDATENWLDEDDAFAGADPFEETIMLPNPNRPVEPAPRNAASDPRNPKPTGSP